MKTFLRICVPARVSGAVALTPSRRRTAALALGSALLIPPFAWTEPVHAQQDPPAATQEDADRPAAAERAEARADEAAVAPQGEPQRISDWALAGTLWSDTHLVRKLAQQAAEQSDDPEQKDKLLRLELQSEHLINSLESFGWRRVAIDRAAQPAPASAAPSAPAPAAQADPVSADVGEPNRPLPDPEQVGQELAASLGVDSQASVEQRPDRSARGRAAASRDGAAGTVADKAAIGDERAADGFDFDIAQYRLVEPLDPSPAVVTDVADAVGEGTEAALAAGVDNFEGGLGALPGRISEREAMTQSGSLPFAGSVYDSDDYDPDINYSGSNPIAALDEEIRERSVGQRPGSRLRETPTIGVETSDTPAAATGERALDPIPTEPSDDIRDEADLVENVATDPRVDNTPTVDELARGQQAPIAGVARSYLAYSDPQSVLEQDAAWVEFRLQANQQRWQMIRELRDSIDINAELKAAIVQLRANAQTARRLTSDARLAAILDETQGQRR